MAENLAGKTVVVCEDDGATVVLLRKVLERAGMRVLASVCDGRESISEVLRERPEVVLMDINLPNMDGLEAIRRIRRTYHTYQPAVIMVTAHSEAGEREEAVKAGAAGYVVKPFTPAQLLAEVSRALEVSRPHGRFESEHHSAKANYAYSASPA